MSFKLTVFIGTLACVFILSACAPPGGGVTIDSARATVAADLEKIYAEQPGPVPKMKIEDALARAIKHNLDTRVAELDELIAADDVNLNLLNILPSATAKVQRVGRSNRGGSSSLSLLTGLESLQPSISTDQYRNTQLLNVEWNLLEAGINIGRARSASDRVLIAQERRRKVYQNVVQDTYTAFWRVAVAQDMLPRIDELIAEADKQGAAIDEQIRQGSTPLGEAQDRKSALLERRRQLSAMKQGLQLADIELKTLVNYPLDQPLAVDPGAKDWLSPGVIPVVKGTMDDLEQRALLSRPEIREEILNKKISVRDIRMSIFETFPGAEFVLGFNRDSNSFLAYNSWVDGVMGLTQALNKVITAPVRYNRAKRMDELADRRRQALVAAVLTQVHVARTRYDSLLAIYRDTSAVDDNARAILKRAQNMKDAGALSGADLLNARIDAGISAANRSIAYADLQESYGRFIATMGVDLWEADSAGLSVPDFASQIRNLLDREDLFVGEMPAVEAAAG